jgi:hypothetical protein
MIDQNSENESISKGKEIGQIALDAAKFESGQALTAIKTLISDPIGGQSEALKELGNLNTLKAGILLIAGFCLSCFLLGYGFASQMIQIAKLIGGEILEVKLLKFIFIHFHFL